LLRRWSRAPVGVTAISPRRSRFRVEVGQGPVNARGSGQRPRSLGAGQPEGERAAQVEPRIRNRRALGGRRSRTCQAAPLHPLVSAATHAGRPRCARACGSTCAPAGPAGREPLQTEVDAGRWSLSRGVGQAGSAAGTTRTGRAWRRMRPCDTEGLVSRGSMTRSPSPRVPTMISSASCSSAVAASTAAGSPR
jgi:hypothetical protein